ncbi:unnamed protein product [Chrysodeixis includens]|uniref:Insulin-like domain-containing protein n=1 Tax=Chrysodeixis includens TaxID=689277 RepID=A0A9P0FWS9_CHRIL|nr:unnamed protein product [Chrysodeixis includens]
MKLLLVLIVTVACAWSSEAESPANVYCGRRLAEFFATVCVTGNNKRDAGWWLMDDDRMQDLGIGTLRGKRGLVDECCEKACTVEELIQYC